MERRKFFAALAACVVAPLVLFKKNPNHIDADVLNKHLAALERNAEPKMLYWKGHQLPLGHYVGDTRTGKCCCGYDLEVESAAREKWLKG